jgi:hypothetical protein
MGLREFFRTSGGKAAAVAVVVAAGVALWYSVKGNFGGDPAMAMTNDPVFIDTEGHSWNQKVSAGMEAPPVKSPFTGKKDGYPAELCYWTKEGTIRSKPFPVLLNKWIDKPGPTFCPDCGRLVTEHNKTPQEHPKPPPTEAEYDAKSHESPE